MGISGIRALHAFEGIINNNYHTSQEMSDELLGVVLAPADNTTTSTTGMAPRDGAVGELRGEGDSCQGSPPSLMIWSQMNKCIQRCHLIVL